jgi:hypothetical protein
MLATNSLKNDMQQSNQYVVGLALCALANISTPDMCRTLYPEVRQSPAQPLLDFITEPISAVGSAVREVMSQLKPVHPQEGSSVCNSRRSQGQYILLLSPSPSVADFQ